MDMEDVINEIKKLNPEYLIKDIQAGSIDVITDRDFISMQTIEALIKIINKFPEILFCIDTQQNKENKIRIYIFNRHLK